MKTFTLGVLTPAVLAASLLLGVPAGAQVPAQAPAPATESLGQPNAVTPDGTDGTPQPVLPTGPIPDWMKYQNTYVGEENDLSTANRTSDEIMMWASHAATFTLSLVPKDLNGAFADIKKSFTTQGWNEYGAYIQQAQILDMVQNREYSVATIVKNGALIVDSGPAGGNYHWLVKLPIMVTLLHDDASGHAQAVQGGDFELTMQIGRVAAGSGAPDNMAIEGWKVEAKAPDTNP